MENEIEKLGKGAIPDSPDARDYQAHVIMGAITPIDFSQAFRLSEPPSKDQNGSGSCVGQGWSYYHWQLEQKDFCVRDIYSWIFLPGGGAQIRDGGLRIVNNGQEILDIQPDPNPETENAMEDRTGLDPNKEKLNKELNSFVVNKDIDSVATAIKQYKGVVFGVIGSNEGWQSISDPRAPLAGEVQWGHCLYLFGYCLRNGKKCVVAKSSWGTAGNTTVHYISEDYFANGGQFIFNPWTLIPLGAQSMQLVNDGGTFFIVGELGKIGIADPTALALFQKVTAQVTVGSSGNVPQVSVFKTQTESVLAPN